jgi:hypothetical protein
VTREEMLAAFKGHVIPSGTRVRITHLTSTDGYFVHDKHLNARRSGASGVVLYYIPGHGGDVYAVAHDGDTADDPCAVYGWWEMQLL